MRVKRDGAWMDVAAGDYRVGDRLPFKERYEYHVEAVTVGPDGVQDLHLSLRYAQDSVGG